MSVVRERSGETLVLRKEGLPVAVAAIAGGHLRAEAELNGFLPQDPK